MDTYPNIVIKVDDDGVSSLGSSWRIPRPSIHGSSSSSSRTSLTTSSSLSRPPPMTSHLSPALTQYQHNLLTPHRDKHGGRWSSSHSTSSASSATEGSQSQLLSPSRLEKDLDTVSIASSTHFTIVNGVGGNRQKTSRSCCSGSYQLPILVATMTFLIFLGILAGVLFIQLRARSLRQT